jgi:glutaredoxin
MIKVYTHPFCPKCLILKQNLINNGVAFEEINISKQEDIKNELKQKTGGNDLPVVVKNGKYLVNPSIEELF